MPKHNAIDTVLHDLGYGPNLTVTRDRPRVTAQAGRAGARPARAQGPRPRSGQPIKSADEKLYERAFEGPTNAAAPDPDADLSPSDRALMRAWRKASPATLDEDQAPRPTASGPKLDAADAALYRKAWGNS